MSKIRLSMMDSAFLLAETRDNPMHVGGVNLYTLPQGVDCKPFLNSLSKQLKSAEMLQPIFENTLKTSKFGALRPMYFEPDAAVDLDYHIRHSALPHEGSYRELFTLVSRLHSTLLDRKRPLWEMYLIEGVGQRQFATYTKYHHAAIDGTKGIHLGQSMLSSDPNAMSTLSPLSIESMNRYRGTLLSGRAEASENSVNSVFDRLKEQYRIGSSALSTVRQFSEAAFQPRGALSLPWMHVPRSPINTPIEGARRFVAQSWAFGRFRAIAKALDGTFNDAVLAVCSGALRRFLLRQEGLPDTSLKAAVPVSLRKPDDLDSANAVGVITADLATQVKDPTKRFEMIRASMIAGKRFFDGMTAKEVEIYTQITQLPGMFLRPLGLIPRFPPFNIVISNVPGPAGPMYWNGAQLEGVFLLRLSPRALL
ncbi:MAG: wax ester/triacylglycerol synthase family O-acyltransferase [Pseudomonadota bacterium]